VNTTGCGCGYTDSALDSLRTVLGREGNLHEYGCGFGAAHGTLTTGPTGQIWDVISKLKRNHRYALVSLGEIEDAQS